ncbi:competence protein CoiA [Ectobacillus funiculus]|uniref:Competence protein CoiA n=1 Tax=Ectobacillus funiculus TaxID=137993 RepID=A0ABV5WPT7_9BACI
MFVALKQNGERLNLLQPLGKELLQEMREREVFFCPVCESEVQLKLGTRKKYHFAHKRTMVCKLDLEPESAYHLAGKEMLYHWFKTQGFLTEPEVYLPSIRQRPDLLLTRANVQAAVEFQCSPIPTKRFLERTHSYWREGLRVLWILGGNQYKRYAAHWLRLSSFPALFAQNRIPYVLYFCPDHASFFKCSPLLPFSSSTSFAHTFVHRISSATISSIFSPSLFSFEQLGQQWLQKKKRWRMGQFLHMRRGYEEFFQYMYTKGISPSRLPAEAGVPLPSLLAIQTPAIIWQSLILFDLIEPMRAGESLPFWQIVRYVEQHSVIQRRVLPYYPFSYFKRTLKEYMAFLCASDLIELVSGQTYRRKQVSIVPQTEGEAFARDEEAMKHALLLFRNEQSATSAAEKRI